MAISDIVVSSEKVRRGPACTVCEALERLPEKDAAGLTRLLSDPTVRYSVLEADLRDDGQLAELGIDPTASTLSRHARGRCEARTKLR